MPDIDLQAAREAAEKIGEAIKDYWGDRCPDSDPDCACCQAWAEFDRLTGIAYRPADYVGELLGGNGLGGS